MNDDQRLLASAYIDGALSDEDRARAEADPEVMAALAGLRRVGDALQVTSAPDADRRERTIAAALAAFDERASGVPISVTSTPVAPPLPSLDARRRSRWLMPLTAAAAVAVLAVGGIVALQQDGGSDGDDAATELRVASATTGEGLQGEIGGSALDAAAPEPAEDAASDDAASAATAAAAAPVAGSDAATEAAGSMEVLTSPAELAAFAQAHAGVDGGATTPSCDAGTWVGMAHYRLPNGSETAVEVFIVAADNEAVAVDLATCEAVARAALP